MPTYFLLQYCVCLIYAVMVDLCFVFTSRCIPGNFARCLVKFYPGRRHVRNFRYSLVRRLVLIKFQSSSPKKRLIKNLPIQFHLGFQMKSSYEHPNRTRQFSESKWESIFWLIFNLRYQDTITHAKSSNEAIKLTRVH